MTLRLHALAFDARDPGRLARFWGGVLGRPVVGDTLPSGSDDDFLIRFTPTTRPKLRPNQMHLDLTSTSLRDQQATVDRALALGGAHHDVGQLPEDEHVVLVDPEGNELCVIEPTNRFLAGCPAIGALSSDGSQAVGYFWSEALGWPLVWDQDEETAIRSVEGGSIISWGGPPFRAKDGRNRLRLELAPTPDTDQATEVARLLALGASYSGESGESVELVDPDGNELVVLGG
ncbi:VOC family protein [Nocardioides plantarum]|uniref:VOC family protein n=1 Tax=Nocardioides plantarum TaxID=29299 RepID=A0ABV5KD41_9ACTN|nr:VOC family protein [Nocardioides plantarum]